MLNRSLGNPWRVQPSDDEDVIELPFNRSFQYSSRPATPQFRTKLFHVPGIADWAPSVIDDDDERSKKKFGRKKTAPIFVRAPPDHKPIFCGPPTIKASSRSLPEYNQDAQTNVSYIPDTPPASILSLSSSCDPFKLIQEDLTRFVNTSIPKDYPLYLHCFLRRDKMGLQKGLFPTYYLHAKRPGDGQKIFLLAARKVAKVNRHTEYIISTDIETLGEKSGGEGCAGKLRCHGMMSSEYTLYDNGKSPNKYKYKKHHAKYGLRRELAGVTYKNKLFESKSVRELNAIIPKIGCDIQPAQDESTIFDRWKNAQFNDILGLRNLAPEYFEEERSHMLQYLSNTTVRSSVKNFQMVIDTEDHKQEIVMQFGRINSDTYICDFRYPLSPLQAFGIAIGSFDSGFI